MCKYTILVVVLSTGCMVKPVSTEVVFKGMTAEQVEQSKMIIDITVSLFEERYSVSVGDITNLTIELKDTANDYNELTGNWASLSPSDSECMADTALAHEVLHYLVRKHKVSNPTKRKHSHVGLWYSGIGSLESIFSVEMSAIIDTCSALCPQSCKWDAWINRSTRGLYNKATKEKYLSGNY